MVQVSLDKKFIFIHIPKNAGSSIRVAFDSYFSICPKPRGKDKKIWEGAHDGYYIKHSMLYRYNNFYRFAIIRNPWDRFVSYYFYRKSRHPDLMKDISFKKYIMELPDKQQSRLSRPQARYVCYPGTLKLGVDYIMHYEWLQEDCDKLCAALGIPKVYLGHVNKTPNKPYVPYITYYDSESIKKVEDLAEEDIKLFHYTFD